MKTNIHFWSYIGHFFLEWDIFQTKVLEKIKIHILHSITFFFFRKCAVCEIMWKHIAEPDRPQMTIWRMRFTCRITKATNTHSEYAILIASHGNNGYMNAPRYYVVRALPLLLFIDSFPPQILRSEIILTATDVSWLTSFDFCIVSCIWYVPTFHENVLSPSSW
jgi:hypothetical protein